MNLGNRLVCRGKRRRTMSLLWSNVWLLLKQNCANCVSKTLRWKHVYLRSAPQTITALVIIIWRIKIILFEFKIIAHYPGRLWNLHRAFSLRPWMPKRTSPYCLLWCLWFRWTSEVSGMEFVLHFLCIVNLGVIFIYIFVSELIGWKENLQLCTLDWVQLLVILEACCGFLNQSYLIKTTIVCFWLYLYYIRVLYCLYSSFCMDFRKSIIKFFCCSSMFAKCSSQQHRKCSTRRWIASMDKRSRLCEFNIGFITQFVRPLVHRRKLDKYRFINKNISMLYYFYITKHNFSFYSKETWPNFKKCTKKSSIREKKWTKTIQKVLVWNYWKVNFKGIIIECLNDFDLFSYFSFQTISDLKKG